MLAALRRGATTAAERAAERNGAGPEGLPLLSMPAAELFGAWAVAEAVGEASRGEALTAVIA
eukprot:5248239-Pleurochrysis_carterae.AAC.1